MHNKFLIRFPRLYAMLSKCRSDINYEKILYLRKIRKGDIVLDIGANRGYYTTLFSLIVGKKGHVHAFEPVPETFDRLNNLRTSFNNITAFHSAVGEKSDKGIINYDLNDSEKASLLKSDKKNLKQHETKICSVDDYVKNQSLTSINFIKCDVEGFELEVIEGATNTLKEFMPNLCLEVTLEKMQTIQLITNLKSFGYKVFKKVEYGFPRFDIENHHFISDDYFYLYASC